MYLLPPTGRTNERQASIHGLGTCGKHYLFRPNFLFADDQLGFDSSLDISERSGGLIEVNSRRPRIPLRC